VSAGIASLKAYERAGVPRPKLMMGSAWYGRQCRAQTLGAAASGPWIERTYDDVVGDVLGLGWTQHRSDDGTPWLSNARTGQVLTYEDPECVKAKVDWVRNNGFGGVFCWEWGQDNAKGDMAKALLQISN
jgi:chitinase